MAKNSIKYIALYQSKNEFHDAGRILWYGKIKNINPVKRNEIYELPKADESSCNAPLEVYKTVKGNHCNQRQIDVIVKEIYRNSYTL